LKKYQIYHLHPRKTLSHGVKIAKIAHGLCFVYDTTLVAMVMSFEKAEKNGPYRENSRKYLAFGEKIVKVGPVDNEIALIIVKKIKKINKKKLRKVKYISRSASLPSGLNDISKIIWTYLSRILVC